MKTIAEQCGALGWTVEELLGKTAREVRTLGFEIPTTVPQEYTLHADENVPVDISTHGKKTGLAWIRPPVPERGN
jgi:hypothetical protein